MVLSVGVGSTITDRRCPARSRRLSVSRVLAIISVLSSMVVHRRFPMCASRSSSAAHACCTSLRSIHILGLRFLVPSIASVATESMLVRTRRAISIRDSARRTGQASGRRRGEDVSLCLQAPAPSHVHGVGHSSHSADSVHNTHITSSLVGTAWLLRLRYSWCWLLCDL